MTTCSGVPLKRARSSGSWVATPDRAGVQVADAHHDAAGRDQRCGRESHLVGAEQRGDDDVAPGPHLTVGLQDDAVAELGVEQRLLGLGEAELPGHAGRLDRGLRRGAGAAVVPGDDDVVGARLDDADGDCADAGLGGELDRDRGARVGGAQVVDQLLEVLDRVDVVVRGRGDQLDARGRVPQAGDVVVDLVAGQLPALARLRALGDLDLELVGMTQVVDVDAEAARGDLADAAAALIAVRVGRVTRRGPRRPRPSSSGRRACSSPRRASRAPPSKARRGSSLRSRSA